MEQPTHDLRAQNGTIAQGTPRRFIAFGAVAALHVILIYALAAGLVAQITKLPEELKAEVVQEKIPDKIPPPPPPDLAKPPPPFVPPPEINIQADTTQTKAITTQAKVATPPPTPAAIPTTPPKPIHAKSLRRGLPADFAALGEEGKVTSCRSTYRR